MLDASGADQLEVPMAWFQAEQLAKDLITPVKGLGQLGGFECDAAEVVLALTLLFSGMTDQPGELSHDQLELMKDLVTPGTRWLDWCDSLLNVRHIPASSLEFARRALQWLLVTFPISDGQIELSPGAGCRAGLKAARLALAWALSLSPARSASAACAGHSR
jgi:hypothetical protein